MPPCSVPVASAEADPTIPHHFVPVAGASDSDQDEWGDSVHSDPGDLHRVYFQNVDGVCNSADDIDLYISSMAHIQAGTFCWADPGLDFSQPTSRQNIKKTLRSHFRSTRTAFSSSDLPSES